MQRGIAGLLLLLLSSPVMADTDSAERKAKSNAVKKPAAKPVGRRAAKPSVKQRRAAGITPAREAAVMKFVERHHTELQELLIHLKEGMPKEYSRAVRDLFRVSERLANMQERDFDRYELELESWKAKSRRQLVAARLRMEPRNAALKAQLEAALNTEYDLRLEVLRYQRDHLVTRTEKLDEQIDKLSRGRESSIARQLQTLSKGRLKKQAAKSGKPQ